MKLYLSILLISLFTFISVAQVPIGSWQEHIAVNDVFQVQQIDNKIYAIARTGYYIVDTEENVMIKRTKLNGLSDVNISAAKVVESTKQLIIGYSNGNIDIIKDDKVVNIPDLKLKTLTSSKTINNIDIINNKAFLATDFGILVVDYNNQEISDTYYIGDNASEIKIYEICSHGDSIYAATVDGVLGAPINSNALAFYGTWENVYPTQQEFIAITSFDDGVLAVKKNGNTLRESKYIAKEWTESSIKSNFIKYQKQDNSIFSIYKDSIQTRLAGTLVKTQKITTYNIEDISITPNFSSIIVNEDKVWVGDNTFGLIAKNEPNDYQYLPNGPASNQSFKIAIAEEKLYSVAGIYRIHPPIRFDAELSIFNVDKWITINSTTEPQLNGTSNFCDIAIDPTNMHKVYISSAWNGIFEFEHNTLTNIYNYKNSPIDDVFGSTIVNGITIDPQGNLIANNLSNTSPIIVKPYNIDSNPNLEKFGWYRNDYYKCEESNIDSPWYKYMINTRWGHIWAIADMNNIGIHIFDFNETLANGDDDRVKGPVENSIDERCEYFTLWDENGDHIIAQPICFAEDKDGYIWVGTSSGILVYYRPQSIFDEDKPIASRIKISRNDGSDLADYLLENVKVTTIAVDGANRKWIGTETEGIYLVSANGTETLHHFTADNTPLLSNYINSIAINQRNGEVYFATDNGIMSYRSDAIEGKEDYSKVYAFPNPVKPGYSGNITITGLQEQSNIRITDIGGKVVYQAMSTGGQAIWSGKNMYNQEVKSGVYIVFANNKDGSESVATKIMIIR